MQVSEIDTQLPDFSYHGLNVGLIGCGRIARFHADVLKAIGISIQAVCSSPTSTRISAFAEEYSIPRLYETWQQMMDKERLNAVFVLAPWDAIDGMLLPLLQFKTPVFFEKPVALMPERIEEAINTYPDMIDKVQIGYNRRFYDFIPIIKELLAASVIKAIEVHIPESPEVNVNENLLNNFFIVNSSHVIDLLLYLLDFPAISLAEIRRHIDSQGFASGYNGLLIIDNSIPVHLIACWNSPSNFGLKFHSDGLLVELLPIETARIYDGFEVIEPTRENPIPRYKPHISQEFFMDPLSARYKPGFLKQTLNFVETCILGARPNIHGANLPSALKVTELCQQVMAGNA
jgi:predicted dehydrogenase